MPIDPITIGARRALLDGLEALHPHLSAIIVVGAQAIYLQIDQSVVQTPEHTKDADLCLKPAALADSPALSTCLEGAGFQRTGAPGLWRRKVDAGNAELDIYDQVDLLVPHGAAPPGGRRGVRLGGEHDKRDAMKVRGLEGALLDHDFIQIRALDTDDTRVITAAVAGPMALLVAKLHKLGERFAHDDRRPDRVHAKDAVDVLRILRGGDLPNPQRLSLLMADETAGPVTAAARAYLVQLFGTHDAPGSELAAEGLEGFEDGLTVRASCAALAAEVLNSWPTTTPTHPLP